MLDLGHYGIALSLGILEGLTEFLPVSSTGHLILLGDLTGFQAPPGKIFEIVIQLGAVLAVCVAYFTRLWRIASSLHSDPLSRRFLCNMIVAFLPAALVGVVAHEFIVTHLFHPLTVACSLIVGGVVMLWVERRVVPSPSLSPQTISKILRIEEISVRTAFWIGCFQMVAMIPGVSRSGATIIGAMLAKLDRAAAAEFSFFLAIPTLLGASVYSLYTHWADIDANASALLWIGGVTAFCTALLVVKCMIGFVSRRGFTPFAIYRIILGGAVLFYYAIHHNF